MAGQDETTQQGVAGTVQTKPGFLRLNIRKKFLLFFAVPAAGLCILYVLLIGPWLSERSEQATAVRSPSPKAYSENQVKLIEQNPPVSSAPLKKKLTYYDNLYSAQIIADDYRSAAQTFVTREKLSTEGLGFRDYYGLAYAYSQAGDTAEALRALDKTEQLLPSDDPESGYVKSETLEKIQAFRQRLQQQ